MIIREITLKVFRDGLPCCRAALMANCSVYCGATTKKSPLYSSRLIVRHGFPDVDAVELVKLLKAGFFTELFKK